MRKEKDYPISTIIRGSDVSKDVRCSLGRVNDTGKDVKVVGSANTPQQSGGSSEACNRRHLAPGNSLMKSVLSAVNRFQADGLPILSFVKSFLDKRLGEWQKRADEVRREQQAYDRVPIQERGGLPRVVWVEGVKFWLGAAGEFRKSWDTFMRRSLPAVTQPDAPEATQKPASTLPQQFWQSARAIPSAIRQSQAPIPVLWKNFTQWLGSLPPLMPGGLFVRFPTIAGSLSNASSATDPIGYAYLITRLRIDEMGRTQGESRDRIHRAISDLEKNKAITQSLSFYFRKYPYARFATTMSSLVVALADMNVLERELYVKQLHVWDRMYPDVSPVVFRDLVEHLHAAPAELLPQYIYRYIAE